MPPHPRPPFPMPAAKKATTKKVAKKTVAKAVASPEPIEKMLWAAANKLRKSMDAAEYKHVVLGLVFLKYISDSFEALHSQLAGNPKRDAEDRDYYLAENVFWVPKGARWNQIQAKAKAPAIGAVLDNAMTLIEKENKSLKGILPHVFNRQNVPTATLGALIDKISDAVISAESAQSKDILGKVYEYFLGQFALAEGKKGGQFYTPESIVKLLVEMIEPYAGRVLDPCCGSGGMFVMSDKFVREHQGQVANISIYGQESAQTTYHLCRMNLAIRNIDGTQVKWNNDGSFLNDAHPDLKADFILANPPFNDSNWDGEQLRNDVRWKYGAPSVGNANFAWVQHFIHHLSPKGVAGFVLSNGSLTSKTANANVIRQNIVEAGIVDCIVALPDKLFLNTTIPACLWFISNKRHGFNGDRKRKDEVLFIDAREFGDITDRNLRMLHDDDIKRIVDTYHKWRKVGGRYKDVTGFCASVKVSAVAELGYVLNPSGYVGVADVQDDFDFDERFADLTASFEAQVKEESNLNKRIRAGLLKVNVGKTK